MRLYHPIVPVSQAVNVIAYMDRGVVVQCAAVLAAVISHNIRFYSKLTIQEMLTEILTVKGREKTNH